MNRQSKFPHFTWSHFTTMQIKTKQAYLHELTMEQVRCSSLERNTRNYLPCDCGDLHPTTKKKIKYKQGRDDINPP